jgi:hypothetical protein
MMNILGKELPGMDIPFKSLNNSNDKKCEGIQENHNACHKILLTGISRKHHPGTKLIYTEFKSLV